MIWQQYRKEEDRQSIAPWDTIWKPFGSSRNFACAKRHNHDASKNRRHLAPKTAVKEKIHKLRHHNPAGTKRLSSVSLPRFSRARLRAAIIHHRKNFNWHWQHAIRRWASENEILLACLVLLLSKLKSKEGLARKLNGPRLRLYNEDKYSYETVSVYAERELWLALQARALELEVSLSYLADLAVRLYLRQVMAKIEQRNESGKDYERWWHAPQNPWRQLIRSVGVDYLRNLLHSFSYQKRPISQAHTHHPRGRPGVFSLRLDYSFGATPP